MIKPLDVAVLFKDRPGLFEETIPSLAKRSSMFVGELVKIAISVRDEVQRIDGRWLIVESISHSHAGLKAVGRSWKQFYKDDFCYEFGPESIYRMEPRRFFVWGSEDGIPIAMRSGVGPDDSEPCRPLGSQGHYIERCTKAIADFTALGKSAARRHYQQLASENLNWPTVDELS